MKGQINVQVVFNPKNQHHMNILSWLNEQSKNRSSYIRELLFNRMEGKEKAVVHPVNKPVSNNDESEILNLLN
ncbi:hypothetical protein [Chengkuizengella axinellae]|uniref:Uncharacterized protein n=1 Tax=Chengkuizengella axinellae TaxID=3064388 RepID=A0ABT9J103_9BACL|nr:hypothetical protein [Chengkuizengella sp. 2205SS18-9]MDP5275253.1 hypothetical protein [Chengkuizengella sp. 2205SS18-9]